MTESVPSAEGRTSNLIEGLRELQGQYMMLADLVAKKREAAEKLVEIISTIQQEADITIPLKPERLGSDCRSAYLVANGVVVMFDVSRDMTSKSLSTFPPDIVVSVVEECTAELGRQISDRRRTETETVNALEKVLKELKRAQATFAQARADESHLLARSAEGEQASADASAQKGGQVAGGAASGKNQAAFQYKGSFGNEQAQEGSRA